MTESVWTITWEMAKLTRDVEWVGKQDPYILFKCAGREWRSKVLWNAGKNPEWHQTSDFIVQDNSCKAEIEIWDWEAKGDRIIGSTEVVVADLVHSDGDKEIELFFKGEECGRISIKSVFATLWKEKPGLEADLEAEKMKLK